MRMIRNGRRGSKLLTVMVLGLSLLACSASDDTRPLYTSNVVGAGSTLPVSNLSNAQAMEICRSYDAYVNANVDLDAVAYLACMPAALLTSATRAACQTNLQNCMAVFPKPIQVSAKAQTVQVCASTLAQCQAPQLLSSMVASTSTSISCWT